DHKWLRAHPTISQDLYSRLGHGDIVVRPAIKEFEGHLVRFIDGSEEKVDLIIWCTGYKISFPFFDASFLTVKDNYLPLWQRMILPGVENLFFVGLLQPRGSLTPPAERQAKVIVVFLCGAPPFREREIMPREMIPTKKVMDSCFVKPPRHTIEVDFVP